MTTRNLVPRADGEGSLGTAAKQWGAMRAKNIYINGVDVTEAVAETAEKADAAATSATNASNSAAVTQTLYDAIAGQYGYPFTASTVADMTDPTKIYVYTGSETGYTAGDWYYYNGSAWVSGGVFNSNEATTKAEMSLFGIDDLLWDNTNPASTSSNGVTWTVDKVNKTVTVTSGGQASTASSTLSLYFSATAVPAWLQKGKKYYIHIDDDKVFAEVAYKVNETWTFVVHSNKTTTFVIPATVSSLNIRLYVASGTVVNTVVRPYISEYRSLKEMPFIDPTLSVSGDGADAKVTGEKFANLSDSLRENVIDLLAGGDRSDRTNNGVTFTWNADKTECIVDGTASGVATTLPIKGTSTSLIDGMVAGQKYFATVVTTDQNAYMLIYWFASGAYLSTSVFCENTEFTVPATATGMSVHISVPNGKHVDNAKVSNLGIFTKDPQVLNSLFFANNDEYLSVVTDSDGNLLEAQTREKKIFFTPVEMPNDSSVGPVDYQVVDNNEFIMVEEDSEGAMLEATTKTEKKFFLPVSFGKINWNQKNITDLSEALKEYGINTGQMDWSDAKELAIPMPRCAIVNIQGSGVWPVTKVADQAEMLEFWDCQGNYFKKPIVFNAQGQSTMVHPKKNGSIDICNDAWIGDDTFSLKIGEWVPQDSFHLKAYYLDFFRGVAVISYQLMNDTLLTRGAWKDRPWKKALVDYENVPYQAQNFGGITQMNLQIDTGARNFPDGFPCKVYLNGTFYGLYAWQIKKHRDNMHLKKDNSNHVWLDGTISWDTILGGTIDWSGVFEVRNPKDLWLMDGTKYDADTNAGELIDSTSAYYDLPTDSAKVKKQKQTTAGVKTVLVNLSQILVDLKALRDAYAESHTPENLQAIKDKFDTHFDAENLIDYQIVSDVVQNTDGFARNWQWCTYDGVKWWINMYDVDMSFGGYSATTGVMTPPIEQHVAMGSSVRPNYYINLLYRDEWLARYAYLRDKGIISAEKIVSMMNEWTNRFGEKFYEKEYEKWPDCGANGNSVLNDGWALVEGEMGTETTYDNSHTYLTGDTCYYGLYVNNVAMGYYKFIATETLTGVPPVKQWRYNDSIFRLAKWVNTQMGYIDDLYGYQE